MAINQFYRPKEINKALPFGQMPFNELFEAAKYAREKQDKIEAGVEKLNELQIAKHGLRTRDVASSYNNMVQSEVDALRQKIEDGTINKSDISKAATKIATDQRRSIVEFDLTLTETYMTQRATEGFDKGYQGYFDNDNQQYIQLDPNTASIQQLANDARFIAPQKWQPLYMQQGRATFIDQYVQNTDGAKAIYDSEGNITGATDPYGEEVRFTEEDVRAGFDRGLGEQMFQSNLQGMEFRARQYEEETGKPYTQEVFEEDLAKSMRGLYYTKKQGKQGEQGEQGKNDGTEEGMTQATSLWGTSAYGVKQKEGNFALHEVLEFTKEYKQNQEILKSGGGAVGVINQQAIKQIKQQGLLPNEQAAIANMVKSGDLGVTYNSEDGQIEMSEVNLAEMAESLYPTQGVTDKNKLNQLRNNQLNFQEKMLNVINETKKSIVLQNAELDKENAKFKSMSRHRNELVRLTGADNFDDATEKIENRLTGEEKENYIESYTTNLNTREIVNNREELGADEDKFQHHNKKMTKYITSRNPQGFWEEYGDDVPQEFLDKMQAHYGEDYINVIAPTEIMEYVAVKRAGADQEKLDEMFLTLSSEASSKASQSAYGDNLLVQKYDQFVKGLEDVRLMSNRSYMLEPMNSKSLGVEQKSARAGISKLIDKAIGDNSANLVADAMSDEILKSDDEVMKKLKEDMAIASENGENLFDTLPVSVRWDQGQNDWVVEVSVAGTSAGKENDNNILEIRLGSETNIPQLLATFGVNSELIRKTYQGVNTLLYENYNEFGTVEIGNTEYALKKHESTTKDGIAGEYEIDVAGQRIKTDNIEEVYAFHNNMYMQEDIDSLSMEEAANLVYSMGGSDISVVMDNSGNPFIGNELYIVPEGNGEFNLSNSPGQGREKATMQHIKAYMLNNTLADIGYDVNQRAFIRKKFNMPNASGTLSATYANQGTTPTQPTTQPQTGTMSATYVGNGMTKAELDNEAEIVGSGTNAMNNYMNVADKLGSEAAVKFKKAVTDTDGNIKVYKLGAKGTGNMTGPNMQTDTTASEIDCSGAVCTVKNNDGFNYNLNMTNAAKFYTDFADVRGIQLDDAQDGDLIVMNTGGKGIDHIGMIIIDGEGNKYIAEATGAFDKSVIVPFDERINMLNISMDTDPSDNVVAANTYEIIRDSKV